VDLGTPQPKACTEVLDPQEVRKIVRKARGS
jgi:hypothetical protein